MTVYLFATGYEVAYYKPNQEREYTRKLDLKNPSDLQIKNDLISLNRATQNYKSMRCVTILVVAITVLAVILFLVGNYTQIYQHLGLTVSTTGHIASCAICAGFVLLTAALSAYYKFKACKLEAALSEALIDLQSGPESDLD